MPKESDPSVVRTPERRLCQAHKTNGDPCRGLALRAQNVCRVHGGSSPQAKAKAQERINAAADRAATNLIEWMNNPEVPYNIRLAAARDLLDRAHIGTDKNVDVTLALKPYEQNIQGLLIDTDDLPGDQAERVMPLNRRSVVRGEIVPPGLPQPDPAELNGPPEPGYSR